MVNSIGHKIAAFGEIAEIKRIYSAIETSLFKKKSACLLITSGDRGEGKTTIATGIAAYAARQNGRRILIIDMNWHTPSVHTSFDVDRFFEYDALKAGSSVSDFVTTSRLDNLDILPAVQSSPGEDIPSAEVDALAVALINKARETYSFVIVDTSAMFPANRRMIDPTIISREADGIAVVTLANVTPRQIVKKTMKTLQTAGANVIGVVANQWQNPIV
jgi:capsular exopolysaccharide synthesis family protein